MKKQTIGRLERADFPELELLDLKVKIDTGAYTSSLHATDIHEQIDEGVKYLYFKSLDPEHPIYHGQVHRCVEYRMKEVKSSSGEIELRYIIDTKIVFIDKEYPISLSLTDRSSMKKPVLIGRKFLKNRFVVDVTRTYSSSKNLRSKNSPTT